MPPPTSMRLFTSALRLVAAFAVEIAVHKQTMEFIKLKVFFRQNPSEHGAIELLWQIVWFLS
jgi:hypothetical protein